MYNPNEPRDEEGKWTSFEGSTAIKNAASDKNNFVPAKTIEEAVQRIKDSGVAEVDLKGLKPDQFNAVLKAIEEEHSISPLKLSKLSTYRSSGSTAKALYSPSNNHMTINLSKLKVEEYKPIQSYEQQIAEDEGHKQFIRENYLAKQGYNQTTVYSRINAFNNRIYDLKQKIANGESPRHWTVSSGFQDKGQSLKATIHHELGHYRERVLNNPSHSFDKKSSVSEYGRTSRTEYFAEWYSHYRMNGEKGVPNDLLKIFKSLK